MKDRMRDKSITDINDTKWNKAKKKCKSGSEFMNIMRTVVDRACDEIISGNLTVQVVRGDKEHDE